MAAAAVLLPAVDVSSPALEPTAEEFGQNCWLLRNALSIQEQLQLVENVHLEKLAKENFMGGYGVNEVCFDMESKEMTPFDESAPGKAVSKAKDFITKNCSLQSLKPMHDF